MFTDLGSMTVIKMLLTLEQAGYAAARVWC